MTTRAALGSDAIKTKGWLKSHQWLLLRRSSQFIILGIFLLGPLLNIWIVKGTLASSLTLDTLPLTDPYLLLQVLLTGQVPEATALIGAAIVLVFYLLVGGRVYCSWVCPTNLITDAAAYVQRKLDIKPRARFPRNSRYWILALTLMLALASGTLMWELVNPVSLVFRGIVFGLGMGWAVIMAVFLFDLFISHRAWCGRLCPIGAFYGLIGQASLMRIVAGKRDQCNDCMDCYDVCPEPQVISPALKGEGKNLGPVIKDGACTNCGRCIDICAQDVFHFGLRFQQKLNSELKSVQ
jgi:ferredoxin-type protein NapH